MIGRHIKCEMRFTITCCPHAALVWANPKSTDIHIKRVRGGTGFPSNRAKSRLPGANAKSARRSSSEEVLWVI